MEDNKKSGGGDVRAKPYRGTASGIKPEKYFQLYLHSRPRWAASHPTHIPRRPKKKPLRGKKVGCAEKKLRLTQKMAHRVYQGWHVPTCGNLPQPDPPGNQTITVNEVSFDMIAVEGGTLPDKRAPKNAMATKLLQSVIKIIAQKSDKCSI